MTKKNSPKPQEKLAPWQQKMHEVIFEADTPAGKLFDILLLIAILMSVFAVILDSVASIKQEYGELIVSVEWFFTIIFTIEYIARLMCVRNPLHYVTSFLGIIDLISIIPTYLSLIFTGSQSLIIIRVVRLLRVFRIFKLVHFLGEAQVLTAALKASRRKISVFLITVLCIVTIMGTIIYLIEGAENGFTSIPTSMYWAIVTLTTVGYGDIAPQTPLGQTIASIIMILGYGIIAVPTGIVTTEMVNIHKKGISTQACPNCSREGHDQDAVFCKYCGSHL